MEFILLHIFIQATHVKFRCLNIQRANTCLAIPIPPGCSLSISFFTQPVLIFAVAHEYINKHNETSWTCYVY